MSTLQCVTLQNRHRIRSARRWHCFWCPLTSSSIHFSATELSSARTHQLARKIYSSQINDRLGNLNWRKFSFDSAGPSSLPRDTWLASLLLSQLFLWTSVPFPELAAPSPERSEPSPERFIRFPVQLSSFLGQLCPILINIGFFKQLL